MLHILSVCQFALKRKSDSWFVCLSIHQPVFAAIDTDALSIWRSLIVGIFPQHFQTLLAYNGYTVPSLAEPKRRKCRSDILRKLQKTSILSNMLILAYRNMWWIWCKTLDVSKRLRDLENKIQKAEDYLLKPSPTASLIDPSNNKPVSNLAAKRRFFVTVTEEAHKSNGNAKKAFVFNVPDWLPLKMVQATLHNASIMTHHPRLESRPRKIYPK